MLRRRTIGHAAEPHFAWLSPGLRQCKRQDARQCKRGGEARVWPSNEHEFNRDLIWARRPGSIIDPISHCSVSFLQSSGFATVEANTSYLLNAASPERGSTRRRSGRHE